MSAPANCKLIGRWRIVRKRWFDCTTAGWRALDSLTSLS